VTPFFRFKQNFEPLLGRRSAIIYSVAAISSSERVYAVLADSVSAIKLDLNQQPKISAAQIFDSGMTDSGV
jgi:hypothetical protein